MRQTDNELESENLNMMKHLCVRWSEIQTQKFSELIDAIMTLYWEIAWNRWNACAFTELLTLREGKAGRLLKFSCFYFRSICASLACLWTGNADAISVWSHRCLHTHTEWVCLMGSEPAEWWIPRRKPPRTKRTGTVAELQVGQRGTTKLARNSCPPTPWDREAARRLNGSGVLYKQPDFLIHLL